MYKCLGQNARLRPILSASPTQVSGAGDKVQDIITQIRQSWKGGNMCVLWRRSANLFDRPVIAHRPPPASHAFARRYFADQIVTLQSRIQKFDTQTRSLGDIQMTIAYGRRQVR